MVEDAITGIVAARKAGIPAIGYVGGDHLDDYRETHAAKLRAAGAIIDDLLDVSDFIKLH